MRSSVRWLTLALLAIPVAAPAQQVRALVADASSSGTYALMQNEISEVCSDQLTVAEFGNPKQGGATTNLAALKENKVMFAWMHSDIIYVKAMTDPSYRQLKTLVALYPEDIHVLTLRNSKTKRRLIQTVTFNSLTDLNGYKVGAAGGGAITAGLLAGQGGGGFDVVEFGSGKELLPALDAGTVQAVIFVGGAPLANIETLTADKYKLIPIGETISSKLGAVYQTTTIDYPNLGSGPIKTLAPTALILTRRYTIPNLVAPQARFRQCFFQHLDELKETPGRHPKWQLVDPKNQGPWEWYDLPTTATTSRTH